MKKISYSLDNTIESITQAIILRADIVRLDVRPKGDTLVLSRDPLIPNASYPSIYEALELIRDSLEVYIEIKSPYNLSLIYELLTSYPNLWVSTIDLELAKDLYITFGPLIRVGLTEPDGGYLHDEELDFYVSFVSLNMKNTKLDRIDSIRKMNSNIQIFIFLVNNKSDINLYNIWKADGLITTQLGNL